MLPSPHNLSRGSKSIRGARRSARSRGNNHSQSSRNRSSPLIIWHTTDTEQHGVTGNTSSSKRKSSFLSSLYTLRQSGGISTRTSYLSADTSPKKRSKATSSIDWVEALPSEQVDEYPWMDPDYNDYLLDITVDCPKRIRTRGVSFLYSWFMGC